MPDTKPNRMIESRFEPTADKACDAVTPLFRAVTGAAPVARSSTRVRDSELARCAGEDHPAVRPSVYLPLAIVKRRTFGREAVLIRTEEWVDQQCDRS